MAPNQRLVLPEEPIHLDDFVQTGDAAPCDVPTGRAIMLVIQIASRDVVAIHHTACCSEGDLFASVPTSVWMGVSLGLSGLHDEGVLPS